MATKLNKTYGIILGAEDLVLGNAGGGLVARWRVHVTAVAGTITAKAGIIGSTVAHAEADIVYPIGSTTAASTITAVGIYDIESSGLEVTLSSGTSATLDYIGVVG